MLKYHINIFYSEDNEGFIATIPDLKGCSAFGETPKEALKEVLIAKELWLEVVKDKRWEIPKPKYKPITHQA